MKILIQGWFYLSHSYSIVLQNQLHHWIENREKWDLELFFDKLPFHSPGWKESTFAKEKGPLSPFVSFISSHMWDGEPVDIVYRICFPYDVSPPPYIDSILFLFITCEFGSLDESTFIGGFDALKSAISHGHIHFITPSAWSAKAFHDQNSTITIPQANIHIIPHGIDPHIFKPLAVSNRPVLLSHLSDTVSSTLVPFVFLHIGAMTSNKGISNIVKAFLNIGSRFENAYLILKGHKDLYPSNQLLDSVMSEQPTNEPCIKRILYLDQDLTTEQLAQLYNVADCYITPYIAEGFNIPALEASACGVPVIATAHGPTDEFLVPDCSISIPSKIMEQDQHKRKILVYDNNDLVKAMVNVLTNPRLQKIALTLGTPKTHKSFSWKRISELHIDLFKSKVV